MLAGRLPAVPPHLLFFLLYNLLYFIPLFLVFLWGYRGGGAAAAVGMDTPTMRTVTELYVVGVLSFSLGGVPFALLGRNANRAGGTGAGAGRIVRPALKLADKITIFVAAMVFLASAIALIPLGVYHAYAFSTGEMKGGIWSFSMFCSESLVLLGVMSLCSSSRYNVLIFVLLALLNSVNLLHGTRIFFIVTVMSAVVYAYIRGYLSVRRLLIFGPLMGAAVLGLAYVVFLSRSGLSAKGAFTAARIVSPVVYESLFSQIPLVTLLREPGLWSLTGHPFHLLGDIVANLTPRPLLPEKDSLLFFNRYAAISPLGAMNGYAAGLIYFGVFYPLFYFALGLFGSWLYARARGGSWWLVLYTYFSADFVFRIMRDGYLIPIKMLVNATEAFIFLLALRVLFVEVKRRLAVERSGSAQPPLSDRV